jgi:hypothetical protein
MVNVLEQEHRRADLLHAQVDVLGKNCLDEGHLSSAQARQFRQSHLFDRVPSLRSRLTVFNEPQ